MAVYHPEHAELSLTRAGSRWLLPARPRTIEVKERDSARRAEDERERFADRVGASGDPDGEAQISVPGSIELGGKV